MIVVPSCTHLSLDKEDFAIGIDRKSKLTLDISFVQGSFGRGLATGTSPNLARRPVVASLIV
jgi:hypothetical protein